MTKLVAIINSEDLLEVLMAPLQTTDDLLERASKIRFMRLDLPLDFEIVKGFPVKASQLFLEVLQQDLVEQFAFSDDDVKMCEKVLKRILQRKDMWQYVSDNWSIRQHVFTFIDKRKLVLNRS